MDSQEKRFERVNQKRRTRVELLRAAREIIEKGGHPSVAEVADLAGISRATAYRYFSTPDEIIREAVLDGVADVIKIPPARNDMGDAEVGHRLDDLVSQIFKMVIDNEGVFRALLGSSAVGQAQVRRGGRRIAWLKEAMSPLQATMPPKNFQRLVHALSLAVGIEALVVMRDICELEPQEAEKVLRWTAKTLLAGAMAES
ncbi:TetR/AcrR family transcriptional regulator [Rhizobium leguminosarum]|uniref:TetR/AcrR family transcriptional regulator n=1 Tax=Rhizobium leguminosarum TaxID=384 RepID=UPI001AE78978|nr:TetR/AcrR family transcriptional regulator [Rhizobium leguminosarum]MBP2485045.1 AcrR family transcriptional regulator [Rhizobium leguminosarum]WHO77545.1 TetR/AcrR family transcriptional regulator [Rhizobium leguminosarum]